MQRTLTEKKILKKLDIPDFRHMTKDKVVEFASMLPKMDPEVAKAAIEQFPVFKELANEIVSQYKNILDSVMKENNVSQETFYEICKSIIVSLQKELEAESLTSDDRDRIEGRMIELAQMVSEKDSENKKWLGKVIATVGTALGTVLIFAGAIIGVTTKVEGNALADVSADDDSDDNTADYNNAYNF